MSSAAPAAPLDEWLAALLLTWDAGARGQLPPLGTEAPREPGRDRWGTLPLVRNNRARAGHLLGNAARALEAPPSELVRLGVITSADVLAAVLPQLTARLAAAGIEDPVLAGLYEQAYTAFSRRRSLLLDNLEHQVRFEELAWVAALAPCWPAKPDDALAARRALEQAVMLALTAFPHAVLPNTLVRELATLTAQAGIELPLVERRESDSQWR